MWRDEIRGYRSDWNNALLGDVIASCYLTLLDEVRNFLHLPNIRDTEQFTLYCNKDALFGNIDKYEKLFPLVVSDETYWATLGRSVYQGMEKKGLRLLPVVRVGGSESTTSEVQVTWLPPTGEGKGKAFFNNLGESDCFASKPKRYLDESDIEHEDKRRIGRKKRFEDILLQTGFNLVKFSLSVYDALKNSGVESHCVSPSAVMKFYKTFNGEEPLCCIGKIPVNVEKTPFKNVDNVLLVLKYCKDDENFLENLSGVPLLVTQNNHLHVFNTCDPKFLSRHYGILPQCREMFVHGIIRMHVFNDTISLKSPVLKPFGVQDFAANLHRTLPAEYFSRDGYVRWCPTQESAPNKHWVQAAWNFLNEETKDVLNDLEETEEEKKSVSALQEEELKGIKPILLPLSNWSILPCTETIQMQSSGNENTSVVRAKHYLVPLNLAESVLDFTGSDIDANSRLLVETLRKLSLAEVNYPVLPLDSRYLARRLVASLKTPKSLLKSLELKMATNPKALEGKLKRLECCTILEYFNGNVDRLQERDKRTLRKLPFYLAKHGGLISLNCEMICVLPLEIPQEEMDKLGHRVNVVFLEEWRRLLPLFKFLEFHCVSAIDAYCNFILQHFAIFSSKARLTHLKHIRDVILPTLSSEYNRDMQRLLHCLSNTAIVTSKDGTLKKASFYYEPQNEVFSIMLKEDMFPPEPFNTPEWLSFLRKIGLICEVSQDLFQKFATDVEREGTIQKNDITYKKSNVLVKHLFSRENVVEEGLLRSVCHIRFVATDPVGDELRAIHRQFGEGMDGQIPYIAFEGSVLPEHTKIAWTTASILPHWANPRNDMYLTTPNVWRSDFCNAVLHHLQVIREPTVDQVVFHCQNVCFQLEKENDMATSDDQKPTRTSVMSNIYRFLQANAVTSTTAKEILDQTPCILVDKGQRFVYAKQVVIELYESLEIKPFLYRMPNELSTFMKIFEYLGCSPFITPSNYVMVLDMLHVQYQTKPLHVNEIHCALRAVKGLLETLQDSPDAAQDICSLYLPATFPFSSSLNDKERLPVVLMKATEMIFDNAPLYHDRIQDFNVPFVVDLDRANVCCKGNETYEELIMLLPTKARPQMMSCTIEEKFFDSHDIFECFDIGAASSLRKQLHSEQFYRGIFRLIRHANQGADLDQNLITAVKNSLQRIEFLGMSRIVTHLVHNGIVIQGSERNVPYFLEKVLDSGQQVSSVEDVEEAISTIALMLSEVIAEVCRGLLRGTAMYIPEMLRNQPGKIWSLLDNMKIRQDDSYDKEKGDVFPQPGSFIPIAEHNLLNPAFKVFAPGECVGYELDDPSLQVQEGDAIYIYAVIIEEVSDDSIHSKSKSYKINTGHDQEPKTVRATELYKFHRLQEITSSVLVPSDQQGSSQFSTDKQQILDEISVTLEEAWRLPEDMKRQVIKRLILRWHQDKNPGNEAFCTEVFQHINNEIELLEREQSCRRETWSSDGGNFQGSYGAYFDFWVARARRYNSQSQEYRDSFVRHYGSWSLRAQSWEVPPSFCAANPQPAQARRWFRQAEADLAAADNDIATAKPSYEWACFKCYQVRIYKFKVIISRVLLVVSNKRELINPRFSNTTTGPNSFCMRDLIYFIIKNTTPGS